MCEDNPDCFNSKTLILDTNFFDQINRSIKEEIKNTALLKPIEEQRIVFSQKLLKVLDNIGKCGNNLLFTSSKVYYDEIDITTPSSVLRTSDVDFDTLCMDRAFTDSLSELYQAKINIEYFEEEEEVRQFETFLSVDIGIADVSLLYLALIKSQNTEVIIITDDLKLRNTIKHLKKLRTINFGRNSYTTDNLHFCGSLSFLKEMHSCCKITNKYWISIIWSFERHQFDRYEKGFISREIYDEHNSYAGLYISQITADCDAKKIEEEGRYFREAFGVNNG